MIFNRRRFPWSLLALLLLTGGLFLGTAREPLSAISDKPAASGPRLVPGKAPQVIVVEATYPGASAPVLADAVAGPIEQEVNGVDDLLQLSSRCTNDGEYTLLLRFKPNVDLNLTQVLVQNRVNVALPVLPEAVKHHGITVKKQSPGVRLFVTLHSPKGYYDTLYLANYATIYLKDELARVPGVSDVTLYGTGDYGVRIWLDPDKLAAHRLTPVDALRTLREQKALRDAGGLDRFADSVLKTGPSGTPVRLRDVASVEFGVGTSRGWARFDTRPVVALGISPTTQASPREFSAAVRDRLERLKKAFPDGLDYTLALDLASGPGAKNPKTSRCLLVEPILPPLASEERVLAIVDRYAAILSRAKGVGHVLSLSKNPFNRFPARPCLVAILAPDTREADWAPLTRTLRTRLEEVKGAVPRLRELSGPDGLRPAGYPVDLAVRGPEREAVKEFAEKLLERLAQSKRLTDLAANSRDVPQIFVDIDRRKLALQRVSMQDLHDVLRVAFGSADAGDFARFGKSWKLQVQLAPSDRGLIAGAKRLKVRNGDGEMVPLTSLVTFRETEGPESIDRLDFRPAIQISANPAAKVSLAQARWLCETLTEEVRKELHLSPEYGLVWLQELPPAKALPDDAKGDTKAAAPEVAVNQPVSREVADYEDFTGRATAAASVEIRARVSGYITEVLFKEGAEVKKGDVLIRIDALPYKADLAQAEANLKLTIAERAAEELKLARAKKLLPVRAISKEEYDLTLAQLETARAKVVAMEAARDRAALFVRYTEITAPISGRVGRQVVDPGNLVTADTTLLTTIVTVDPMEVYFEMDERTLLRLERLARQSKSKSLAEAKLPVLVGLADEEGFTRKGTVNFVDNKVNPTTEAVTVRAVLANRDGMLKPGMFARIRLPVGVSRKVLLVPDEAIRSDLERKVVYVVDDENRVASRRVVVGKIHDGLRVIDDGLGPDDRVITEGRKSIRPGMKVRPVKAELPAQGRKPSR
jgi:RND family efflux transporter MFP subunit